VKPRYILMIVLVFATLASVTLVLINRPGQANDSPEAREKAIIEARKFKPGNCTTVLTPALHTKTGARYRFSSGCIPDGWVVDYSQEYVPTIN
jgi:hypothetical protein